MLSEARPSGSSRVPFVLASLAVVLSAVLVAFMLLGIGLGCRDEIDLESRSQLCQWVGDPSPPALVNAIIATMYPLPLIALICAGFAVARRSLVPLGVCVAAAAPGALFVLVHLLTD